MLRVRQSMPEKSIVMQVQKNAAPFPIKESGAVCRKNPKLAAVARKQRFAARPAAWRGGLRTAVALRAVLVLGAAHP